MDDKPKKTLTLKRKTTAPSDTTHPTGKPALRGKRIIKPTPATKPQAKGKPKPPPKNKAPTKRKPPRKGTKKPLASPSDLKARELNDRHRLNAFPVWLNYQPLAVGIDREIFRLVSQEHFAGASKKVVHKCLKWHTTKTQYLQAVQRGGARYGLDGTPAGEITAYQQQLAGE